MTKKSDPTFTMSSYDLAALAAGLFLPGSAHWYIHKRGQAVLIFVVIHFMFLYGLFMGSPVYHFDKKAVLISTAEKISQMGSGLVYWVALWSSPRFKDWPEGPVRRFSERYNFGRGDHRNAWGGIGQTYSIAAGLLNILMLLKAYDRMVRREPLEMNGSEETA